MLFVEQDSQIVLTNSMMEVLLQAQIAFTGEAEKAGPLNDDDVVQMVREFQH